RMVAILGGPGAAGGDGQVRAHHDDLELLLVGRVDQTHGELVVLPLVGERPCGDAGVEIDRHLRYPKATASGGAMKPMTMTPEMIVAATRRAALNFGWFTPMLWNIDQAP